MQQQPAQRVGGEQQTRPQSKVQPATQNQTETHRQIHDFGQAALAHHDPRFPNVHGRARGFSPRPANARKPNTDSQAKAEKLNFTVSGNEEGDQNASINAAINNITAAPRASNDRSEARLRREPSRV